MEDDEAKLEWEGADGGCICIGSEGGREAAGRVGVGLASRACRAYPLVILIGMRRLLLKLGD